MRKSLSLSLLAFSLLLVVSFLLVNSFDVTATSQNANSSTTTNRNQNQNDSRSITPPAAQPDFSKNTWELPEDADKTKTKTKDGVDKVKNKVRKDNHGLEVSTEAKAQGEIKRQNK